MTVKITCNIHLPALPVEDQEAVDRMFEDQGMDIHCDLLAPFNSPDSDHDSENDDEFLRLSEHISVGSVPYLHPVSLLSLTRTCQASSRYPRL